MFKATHRTVRLIKQPWDAKPTMPDTPCIIVPKSPHTYIPKWYQVVEYESGRRQLVRLEDVESIKQPLTSEEVSC